MVPLFLHLPLLEQFNETTLVIQLREEETPFLFNPYMRCSAIMTLITRESQIRPHIVGDSALKYDIPKRSAVPVMSLFPYVLVWKLETRVFLVTVLKPVSFLFYFFLTSLQHSMGEKEAAGMFCMGSAEKNGAHDTLTSECVMHLKNKPVGASS